MKRLVLIIGIMIFSSHVLAFNLGDFISEFVTNYNSSYGTLTKSKSNLCKQWIPYMRKNYVFEKQVAFSCYESSEDKSSLRSISDSVMQELGFDIDWAGITRDEVSAGNEAIYVFLICLVFVVISTIREFFTAFACYFIFANGHIWCIHIGFGKQYLRPSRYDYVDWSFG